MCVAWVDKSHVFVEYMGQSHYFISAKLSKNLEILDSLFSDLSTISQSLVDHWFHELFL